MQVKFCELARRNLPHAHAMRTAVGRIILEGKFILGAEVERFEKSWADYCGADYAIGVASGTDAIALALRAHGIKPGDRVIVPAATSVATWHAVAATGAVPLPVDVDDHGIIDTKLVEETIGDDVTAIVPVHLYGRMANLEVIYEIAARAGLVVVIDAAQGHGLPVVGSTAYSFYPTKNLGALGDGGAVVTNSPEVDAFVRERRHLGGEGAMNSRLDEIQAACLSIKLPHLENENARRCEIAWRYQMALADANVKRPVIDETANVWHQYVIRHPNRDELRRMLFYSGVETGVHYEVPPTAAYARYADIRDMFQKAERLFAECISLPIGSEISDDQVDFVAEQIKACA